MNVNTVAETTITPAQTSEEVVFGNLITTGIKYKGDEHWYQVNTDHISSIVSELSTNNGYVNYTLYNSSLSQIYNKTFYSAGGKYSFKVEAGTYYIKLNESSGVNYSTHIVTLKVDLSKEYDFLLALGNPDWCGKVAEPVNIINGNYFSEDKDLSIPTQSVPLEFIRHYNSRNTDWGPLGKGWQHNYNTYLTINTDNSIAVTYGDGHSSLFTLVNVTDPKNHTLVQNTYDTNSKVIEQEDGKGQKSFMAYDPVLRKNTYTDALGYVTTYYYDDKYRQTKVEYPDGKYILYTYDSDYNKLGETDPRGNTTTYTYDSMGNMLTQKAPAPLSYITIYTYDSLNNPISITDVAGHITNFAYDTKGNLIRTSKTVEGQMAATSYTYDQYGQVNTITNANGKTSQVAYDPVWEPDSDY
ncbi:Rhs family protein [Desulfosporosinus sp. I2]|nr:Rhs family protein [Desulfosporosinus sp. I2]